MKINEGYNLAVKKYGKQIADQIYRAGIPKSFIDTACRFYTEDGVPIETLQDDFKKWNRFVLSNPSYSNKWNKNLNVFKSYLDFKRELQKAMTPFICPNPIYDDGNLSIGELKTQRDARWFPIQNLAYPDDNYDYCVSKNEGGYKQFQKYKLLGYKMLIIYDKSKPANDEFKRAFVIARDGHLDFWNNYDTPCGTTKKNNDSIWEYIDTLPHEAQIALSIFAESTLSGGEITESKTNKNMKKNVVKINENALRQIVAESVKKVLKEGQMGFSRDADSYGEELRSRELNGAKPQRDEMREHSRKILMGIYDDLHTWETYAMGNSNGIDKQSAFDAYRAAMEAIETLGKAFYGDEFWGN